MLEFCRLDLSYKEVYELYYEQCSQKSADISFINLWGWDKKYQTELSFADGLCWLRFKNNTEYVYGPPLGKWEDKDWKNIFSNNFSSKQKFIRIPELLCKSISQAYNNELITTSDRDNWEYLYKISDLISLQGEVYRNQRKLSNQFIKNNQYQISSISEQNISQIKMFQQKWLNQPEIISKLADFDYENEAINKILDNWNIFQDKIFGYYISIDNQIISYSIGEKQDQEQIIIHFEKALYDVRGAYPAINRLTLQNFSDYKYVNREQDLGLIGLRKAKEEYAPIGFVKKYDLILP